MYMYMYIYMYMYMYMYIYIIVCNSCIDVHVFSQLLAIFPDWLAVFLISSYGAPLAQRTSYLAQHSYLFGPDGTVNYDYIVTNSINCLLIDSKCLPNGAHTNHC